MAVKKGYKQTEVGLIPQDWHELNISDVTTKVGSGITPTGGDANYKKYGRPFVRSQNVGWGRLLLDDLAFIDDKLHSTFASSETCEGDVLLNITGASIGRSAVVDKFIAMGNVNQHVCILRPNRQRCNSKFLNGLLLSPIGQKQIDSFQAGGNRQGLNFGQIRAIKIPIPPTLAEQEAIAGALSDADAWIESLEQLIAKKRQIKQGAMQELLTGKRRLPGFEVKRGYMQTEVGVIPGDWDVRPLGKYATFKTGPFGSLLHQSDYVVGGVPVINPMQIIDGKIMPTPSMSISSRAATAMSAFRLSTGDVIIGRRGEMGRCAYVSPTDAGMMCGTGSMVVTCCSSLNGRFLQRVLSSSQIVKAIENASVGTTMVNINNRTLANLRIPLPAYTEQTAIATVLSDMDTEIESLESKLAKAREIKQAMMQELLTGRIRLV
jgi:type I restriction enzyme, S subunit